jgi:hypothetical protein
LGGEEGVDEERGRRSLPCKRFHHM